MQVVLISFVCLFGVFELFGLIGILDFTWAIRREQYHSYVATIKGPAHWVDDSGRHQRHATAQEVKIHNRNAGFLNVATDRMNQNVRKANQGAAGRGFDIWRQVPFAAKYGATKKKVILPLTCMAFLVLAYLYPARNLIFTLGKTPLATVILFAINIFYVIAFVALFTYTHTRLCGCWMDDCARKEHRILFGVILALKMLTAIHTLLYLFSVLPRAFSNVSFFVLFVLNIAYIPATIFMLGGNTVKEELRKKHQIYL
jgi:nitrogen fixation-related uncharacterized protein